MKLISTLLLIAAAAAFTGCSLTPEQEQAMHEFAMRSIRSNSEQLQQQQWQIEQHRQQTLQQIQQLPRQSPPRSIQCTHRMVGDTTYSNCQ